MPPDGVLTTIPRFKAFEARVANFSPGRPSAHVLGTHRHVLGLAPNPWTSSPVPWT